MSATTEQNKAVIQRLFAVWNDHDRKPGAFADIIASDVVRHCEATPAMQVRSLDELMEFVRQDAAVFPDSKQTILHMAAEDDRVGVWASYEGTQRGPIGPLPAAGGRTKFDFGSMFRVADGKIAEWWVTWDNLTIMRQLGHIYPV